MCMCVYVYMCVYIIYIHTHTFTHTTHTLHTHARTHARTHTHTHIYVVSYKYFGTTENRTCGTHSPGHDSPTQKLTAPLTKRMIETPPMYYVVNYDKIRLYIFPFLAFFAPTTCFNLHLSGLQHKPAEIFQNRWTASPMSQIGMHKRGFVSTHSLS